ncbi:calcium calmodulin-dependent protein kinase type 1G [Entomophthora muscae]|uniref:Calcium calmodulin-dependent protein kinase type 1G n=2 Tax=Entomophthora muscae TaxID=34485 RepID=A0ACC2URL5_9FUNG|nr:calcium calmodulin-dependent protein kinase type 1G [Entomophthora muscae]
MFQILLALKYLHDRKIAHRDIKPENILLMTKGLYPQALVTDFGMARVMGNVAMTSVCGTFQYIAPEIILHNSLWKSAKRSQVAKGVAGSSQSSKTGYTVKIDCWSAGVLMYAMLSGSLPFSKRVENDPEEQDLFRSICNDPVTFESFLWDQVSEKAKSMILHLIERDPSVRYGCSEALDHLWFKDHFEGFREYLTFFPTASTETYDDFINSNP